MCTLSDIINKKIRFEIKGDALVFLDKSITLNDDECKQICQQLKVNSILQQNPVQSDNFRSADVKLLYGQKEVTVIQYGIKYQYDATRLMFSPGNVNEKIRLPTLNRTGECVVDMFVGIGYFSLPLLALNKERKIGHLYAIDWNPVALQYFRSNLRHNAKAIGDWENRCTIIQGDNRQVTPTNVADRVILGLIPSSKASWESAVNALKLHTTNDKPNYSTKILHIHENYDVRTMEKRLKQSLLRTRNGDRLLEDEKNIATFLDFIAETMISRENLISTNMHPDEDNGNDQSLQSFSEMISQIFGIKPKFDDDGTKNLDMLNTVENLKFNRELLSNLWVKHVSHCDKLQDQPLSLFKTDLEQNDGKQSNKTLFYKRFLPLIWLIEMAFDFTCCAKKILDFRFLQDFGKNISTIPNYDICIRRLTRVKSYAPLVTHYVMDVEISFT